MYLTRKSFINTFSVLIFHLWHGACRWYLTRHSKSNSIELNPWIEFRDWVRKSNEIEHLVFCEFDFQTNRTQSNKSIRLCSIEFGNRTKSITIQWITFDCHSTPLCAWNGLHDSQFCILAVYFGVSFVLMKLPLRFEHKKQNCRQKIAMLQWKFFSLQAQYSVYKYVLIMLLETHYITSNWDKRK